jgi:hypothetical protein
MPNHDWISRQEPLSYPAHPVIPIVMCVQMMRLAFSLWLVVLPVASAAPDGWPGLPPDCWTESRLVHSVQNLGDLWQKHTKITTRQAEKPQPGQLSPNQGYFFVVEGSRPSGRITIYAEKDHLVEITFTEIFGLSDVRWVNEKLIFMRAWWGRIAATDILFDVEAERILYTETVTDGFQAMQQYWDSCPLHGWQCIKKQ